MCFLSAIAVFRSANFSATGLTIPTNATTRARLQVKRRHRQRRLQEVVVVTLPRALLRRLNNLSKIIDNNDC